MATKEEIIDRTLVTASGGSDAQRIAKLEDKIARLQEAKRRFSDLADERAIEANGVRAENERLRRTETCARLVLKAWETAGAATAQPLTDSIVRLRDALAAEQTLRPEEG